MRCAIIIFALVSGATSAASQIPTPLLPPGALQKQRINEADIKADSKDRIAGAQKGTLWFPIKSQEDAQAFWARGDTTNKILSSGALLLEDKVFGANLELLSDIVGWLRVGLQVTAAAAEEDDETQEAVESADEQQTVARLADAGGTVRLGAAYPLFYRNDSTFNSTWALVLSGAGGTETPKAGGYLEDPAASLQGGVELFYQRGGMKKQIDFEFGVAARGYGFNNAYATKAGVTDNFAGIIAPRVAITLLENTKINLTWRAVRSNAFQDLGKISVSVQQIAR
jgi:hypothetical protein